MKITFWVEDATELQMLGETMKQIEARRDARAKEEWGGAPGPTLLTPVIRNDTGGAPVQFTRTEAFIPVPVAELFRAPADVVRDVVSAIDTPAAVQLLRDFGAKRASDIPDTRHAEFAAAGRALISAKGASA